MKTMRMDRAATIAAAHENLQHGREAENLTLLRDAVARFPRDAELQLLYGTALVPFQPADAPWEIARAIQLDPDDPWRLARAASLMHHLDEPEAARRYAARAAKLSTDAALDALLVNLGAHFAVEDGNPSLAAEAFAAASDMDPQDGNFAFDHAAFLASRGQGLEALAVIERAIDRVSDPTRLSSLRAAIADGDH